MLVRSVEPLVGRAGPRLLPAKADLLKRNVARVLVAGGADNQPDDLDATVRAGFASYGRYWAETFRLPDLDATAIDRGFCFVGFDKIQRVRAGGHGPLLVLPHLGGWEWAAAWLGRIAEVQVTAVVERLEPDDVFEWFIDLRSSYGINVVPLGPGSTRELIAATRRLDIICLLADRDIAGTGRPISFFGEETTLPIGPALLSRRTGSPLMPTAVFFDGRRRICEVGDPIHPGDVGSVDELMAASVRGLERLIARAPEQWHLLEANWPADQA